MSAFISSLILVLFISLVIFYKNSTELTDKEKEFLQQKKEVIFVSQNNYAPFEFVSENLESSGMMIELVRWIGTEFGFNPKFTNTTFANAQEMVQKGDADVLTSFFYSEERDKKFDFTNTVFKIPASIFVHRENNDVSNINDLNGKTIAIQKGDYAIDYLKKIGINYTLVETDDFLAATNKLFKNGVDAVVGDEQVIVFYLHQYDLLGELKIVGDPLYVGLNAMAVKDGDEVLRDILNKGIKLAAKNGILASIERKWLGYNTKHGLSYYFKKWSPALGVFFLSYLFLWFWNISLNKKVKERTVALQERFEELRIANEKLNAILKSSPDGVGICSLDGKLLFASDKLVEMYGFDVGEMGSHIGTDLTNFIHKDFKDRLLLNMQNLLKNQKDDHLTEYMALKKDGTPFWIEVSSTLLYNSKGEPDSILFLERDITQRKVAEDEMLNKNISLKQAYENAKYLKKKADQANELKSKFLAIISHELRTPLNAIIGTIELMGVERSFSEKYMEVLSSSSELLNTIINDLTDLNKIEINKLELLKKRFSLFSLIKSVEKIISFRSLKKGLYFSEETDFDGDIPLIGDPARLKQVLLNLLNNAVKYTERGGVALSVKKTRESESYLRIEFVVEDTGIGIEKSNLERIFLPFFQLEDAHSKRHYGSGIGLYLSKTLVRLMGGELRVESKPGVGSKFYFELEFKKATFTSPSEMKDVDDFSFSYVDVLIVEDSETNLMVLGEILKKIGVNYDIARDGKTAVEKAMVKHYDLIFMDIQMPEMDGFETTMRIREFDKEVKVVAISANVYEDDFRKSVECGMDDFCPKPITLKIVKNMIQRHVFAGKDYSSVDFNRLLEDFGDEKLICNALKLFVKEVEENFKQLNDSLNDSNFEVSRQVLDKIKGAALNVRAEKMSRVAVGFYNNFYSIPTENLHTYSKKLESVFGETKNAIQDYIQSMGTKA